ncbi:MAG: type IX secretion system outer membrane channel protein PorV [Bacteroidetes bacterium]|nr:MAG: type IX secretion system outer membrane channel protein PorV [Bacteroidota bacterium]
MNKKVWAILPLFGFCFQGLSQGATDEDLQLNTITTALPFMSITPDSRSGAMGDVGTAISASSSSVYWNSAMLNFADKNSEISISYTPWLRQLTNDIHLSYLSGYARLGKRHVVGGALRYFSLGEITFTGPTGNVLRDDKPNEFEVTGAYAFKLSDNMSLGVNGKFAYSNLTGGLTVGGAETKAGIAGAADISFAYRGNKFMLSGKDARMNFGATITNLGNKVAYSDAQRRDFIPTTLKLGTALELDADSYNSFTFAVDVQKLLVPTPPYYDTDGNVIAGKNNDIGVVAGMVQSFYDAPGQIEEDDNGDPILNSDGTAQIVPGTKFKEELREWNIGTGIEYWYNDVFAIRTGFFYEHKTKGARQYFNAGLGLKYNIIGIDISYLLALQRNNPLANTLRFTLRFDIGTKTEEVTTP